MIVYGFGLAQLKAQDDGDDNAQANNPLANMTALNFHNYYVPKLTDATDGMKCVCLQDGNEWKAILNP